MPNIKSIITMHNKSTLAKCEPKQNVSTRMIAIAAKAKNVHFKTNAKQKELYIKQQ